MHWAKRETLTRKRERETEGMGERESERERDQMRPVMTTAASENGRFTTSQTQGLSLEWTLLTPSTSL